MQDFPEDWPNGWLTAPDFLCFSAGSHRMGVPEKILVIKPSSLGDVVHVFPALEVLRRSFPESKLDFVIHPAFAELLELSPFPIRKKILFDRKKLGRVTTFWPAVRALLRDLRQEKYDLIIDFQGLFRSGLLAGCARSSAVAGFASPREKWASCFYNKKYDVQMEQHAVPRYVELANKICNTQYSVPVCPLPGMKESFPDLPAVFAVLVPGARWESKKFPPECFGKIMTEIRKKFPSCGAVIAGAAGDKKEAQLIQQIIPDALDLTGRTSLIQLAEVMKKASVVITNDSGPMHVAALTGTRIYALFGPTLPSLTGPWGEEHKIISSQETGCLGCMKRQCPAPEKHCCHKIDCAGWGAEIGEFLKQQHLS